MAIRRIYRSKSGSTVFKAGHFYSFEHYKRYENDPSPLILFMYVVRGIHPNSGHYHNYVQAWNFSYIPKKLRQQTIRGFLRLNPHTPGRLIKLDPYYFPSYMDLAIRRYLLKPAGLIVGAKEVPFDAIEDELLKIRSKDYSRKAAQSKARYFLNRPIFRIKKKRRKK